MASDYRFLAHDYPPFEYIENGKLTGPMVDVVRALCVITKDHCTIEIVSLTRAIEELKQGNILAATLLIRTEERDQFGLYSLPIIKSEFSYLSTSDKPVLRNITELQGWTVAGLSSSSMFKEIKQSLKKAGVNTFFIDEPDLETMIIKLSKLRYGNKGAIATNEDVMNYLAKKNSIMNIKRVLHIKSDYFGIYFSKKSADPKTLQKFNNAIIQLKKSGELKKILMKYNMKMGGNDPKNLPHIAAD